MKIIPISVDIDLDEADLQTMANLITTIFHKGREFEFNKLKGFLTTDQLHKLAVDELGDYLDEPT